VRPYRWCTGNFGPELGFAAVLFGGPGEGMQDAVLQLGARTLLRASVRLAARYAGEAGEGADVQWHFGADRPKGATHKRHVEFVLSIAAAAGGRQGQQPGADVFCQIHGRVVGFVPLRNRRAEHVTTLGEGFTRYEVRAGGGLPGVSVGMVGYGMSEFLDQDVDAAKL
jgi:hypothetical protein